MYLNIDTEYGERIFNVSSAISANACHRKASPLDSVDSKSYLVRCATPSHLLNHCGPCRPRYPGRCRLQSGVVWAEQHGSPACLLNKPAQSLGSGGAHWRRAARGYLVETPPDSCRRWHSRPAWPQGCNCSCPWPRPRSSSPAGSHDSDQAPAGTSGRMHMHGRMGCSCSLFVSSSPSCWLSKRSFFNKMLFFFFKSHKANLTKQDQNGTLLCPNQINAVEVTWHYIHWKGPSGTGGMRFGLPCL